MHSVERLTITLPAELAAQARQAVADGRAESVSAYVREAVEARSGHLETDRAWAEHSYRRDRGGGLAVGIEPDRR